MAEGVDNKAAWDVLCCVERVDALICVKADIESVAVVICKCCQGLFILAARDSEQSKVLICELLEHAIEQAEL